MPLRTNQPISKRSSMFRISSRILIASLAVPIILSGCGGGGGGEQQQTTSTTTTGKYIDSPVAGLTYETATQSGVTDAQGRFQYQPGEQVRFRLYGQEVSMAPAQSVMTANDSGSTTLNIDKTINLLRFLQTIDTDNDPSNGITLPTVSNGFTLNINFDQDIFAFESDSAVTAFLSAHASGRSLVSVASAMSHFHSSLASASDDVILQLAGRTATSTTTTSNCPGQQAVLHYTFGSTSVSATGESRFNYTVDPTTGTPGTCTVGQNLSDPSDTVPTDQVQFTVTYATDPDDTLTCAPNCTYSQFNKMVYVAADADNRQVVNLAWHTPGSNKIYLIKRVIGYNDPSKTNFPKEIYTEIITLN
ncbi:hypothetical protein [Aquabacterium sp.]|uniref:hypothetical protein n=1 Tax=Aquabacterium sp. TaxID=1872578 RepID=UPI004037E8D5